MQLTKNFTLAELTKTNVKHPNIPNEVEIARLKALAVNILQPLRDALGRPVILTNAFRSDAVNRAVGGVASSQHRLGEAADIYVNGMTPLQLSQYIHSLRLPYDQLIREPTWVHVSFREAGRRQLLTMRRVDGRATYSPGLT